MDRPVNVYSEIGKLKTVILHRPGAEIENLTPNLLSRLLFDDIPFLKIAQEEHDAFAKVLTDLGVEVLYLEDLAADSIKDPSVREDFIDEFIAEADVENEHMKYLLKEYLMSFKDTKELVLKMMAGIRRNELNYERFESLADYINADYPFVCDPMPNLYFTRDNFAFIGCGVTLNHMHTKTRNRETLFGKYIFKYHERFKNADMPMFYDRNETTSIEGGDELILSKDVLAIGISQRTQAESIDKLAKRILDNGEVSFKTILAFKIPESRAFMHLDTVFTQVDYDKFTVHPGIYGTLEVFAMHKEGDDIVINKEVDTLENVLSKYLNRKVKLIVCGGGDEIIAGREQWNDGSNTLAVAPGEVVVYSRNYVTNKILEENGIKIHVIPSSELSRGRGGPRCMSMPLYRENLDD